MKKLIILLSIFLSSCILEKNNVWDKVSQKKCTGSCNGVYWKCMESYGDPMLRDCFAEKYTCIKLCKMHETER